MYRTISAALLMASLAASAHAAEATGTLNVQATVLNTCVVSTAPVVFSNVGLTEATATGSITVNCTNSDSFTVRLDGGGSGDINARTLVHATEPVDFTYQLYTNGGFGTVWGDGISGSTLDGSGPSAVLTVHGRTTSTPVHAGSYSDAVQVTVTY